MLGSVGISLAGTAEWIYTHNQKIKRNLCFFCYINSDDRYIFLLQAFSHKSWYKGRR